MGRKVLESVKMGCTWTSYIASVEGALRSAGFWEDDTYKLMGMTGLAFHFIIHNQLCPSSVTVYDWVNEHLLALDRIGIHTEVYCMNDIRMNTFQRIQEEAVKRIKDSIDNGIAVVAWAPTYLLEFGIIYGYDDEDGVFFVQECTGVPSDPLLYTNLGKSEVPMLFYQIVKGRVDIEPEKVYRDSLQFAVNEWNKEFHVNPDYASGRKAYEYLISALERGKFDEFGLAYTLAVYSDAKNSIAQYLGCVRKTLKTIQGLDKAEKAYLEIAEKYKQLTGLFPFSGSNGRGCSIDGANALQGLSLIKECKALEEEAMEVIRKSIELGS